MRPNTAHALLAVFLGALALLTAASSGLRGAITAYPLALASADAKTSYAIVIAKDSPGGVRYAAQELAHFLKEMSGAEFPIVCDDSPKSVQEIVLGDTNRKKLSDVPARLKPQKMEGFVILREGEKLFILGSIPRAVLYGVYDLLDVELGVRFISPNFTHVPKRSPLKLGVSSRRYDPPMEWRNINIIPNEDWAVRNRLNASWTMGLKEPMLGGVRIVGPPWHTFDSLVPVSEFFGTHPEYFSEINGKRKSLQTQLCLTNPDVARILIERIISNLRSFPAIQSGRKDILYIVSVTQNDWDNYCQCAKCKAIDDEEGGPSGSYIRFVNKVADALRAEFPNVLVHAFAYGYTMNPPKKTRPRDNVALFVVPPGMGLVAHRPAGHPDNAAMMARLDGWAKISKHMHAWNHVVCFKPYVRHLPDLTYQADMLRALGRRGVTGFYMQAAQTPASELQDLRYYLLARLMWRPETNGRKTIEEFCRLYFGPASPKMLAYIDFWQHTYDEASARAKKNGEGDYSKIVNAGYYESLKLPFLDKADRILEQAEKLADTPERKLRVANQRLGIWDGLLNLEYGKIGKVFDFPIAWKFRLDPDNVGSGAKWHEQKEFGDWKDIQTDKAWTEQGYDYHGVAWYAVEFDYPTSSPADSLSLYFGGVDGFADFYLDGRKIGELKEEPQMMWDKPFFRPLDQPLRPGQHRLVVRVEKKDYAAGIWRPVGIVDTTQKVSERIKRAGERFIEVTSELGMTHYSEFYGAPKEQFEKDLYPRIRSLVYRNQFTPTGDAPAPGAIRYPVGQRNAGSEPRYGMQAVKDDGTESGWAMQHIPDPNYYWVAISTLWDIKDILKNAADDAKYRLRAKMKVKTNGNQGDAIWWGHAGFGSDWSGSPIDQQTIPASEIKDDEWHIYEFPRPITISGSVYEMAFARPANNPGNIEWLRTDWFELTPVK